MSASNVDNPLPEPIRVNPAREADGSRPTLFVALPALNEAKTIADVIGRIPRDFADVNVRVLVIDDGSDDATADLARQAGATVVSHNIRRGVGAAFQTALRTVLREGAAYLVTIDADGQFDPADIPKLASSVLRGEADFATASRFIDAALMPTMPWVKRWGNHQMSRLISRLTRQRFFDVSCGMRCYNRHAMMSLNLLGAFTYTQEVFLNLAFKQFRIIEVPIKVRGVREHGKSRVASSIWRYAVNTSRIIFRTYRDYFPLRFFGGAAVALLVPGALLGLFLLWYYVTHGKFRPHLWAGFTSGTLCILGLILLVIGIIGDMLNRHRIYLEELLYHHRMAMMARTQHARTRPPDDDDDA